MSYLDDDPGFYLAPGVHRMVMHSSDNKAYPPGSPDALLLEAADASKEVLPKLIEQTNEVVNNYGWQLVHAGRTIRGRRFVDVIFDDDDDPEEQHQYRMDSAERRDR